MCENMSAQRTDPWERPGAIGAGNPVRGIGVRVPLLLHLIRAVVTGRLLALLAAVRADRVNVFTAINLGNLNRDRNRPLLAVGIWVVEENLELIRRCRVEDF